MAMEINGSYSPYRIDYEEQLKTKQQEKAGETTQKSGEIPLPKDAYISSEEADRKPIGLYRLDRDENGNPTIQFDDPKKPVNAAQDKSPKASEESCTANTDQVDKEIKNLKEEKKQLEQQLKAASADEEKTKNLEKKLAQVEAELSQKDNDTYRRQHAVVTKTKGNYTVGQKD
ncbi:MAG: hypothetical protein K2M91_10805 [Lachnospiraceae bacterium]|nr:hypothetical protein [Lachnospiraceae bacterium]